MAKKKGEGDMDTQVAYGFTSQGMAEDLFQVVSFSGEEAVSTLYRFTIELISKDRDLDEERLLSNGCELWLQVGETQRQVQGILAEFEALHQVGEYTLYRAVLVPQLWQLSLYRASEVYLDMSVPDILKKVLGDAGFTELDFQTHFARDYPVWRYRCQYAESHFDFISRLMEREGIYYYFAPGDNGEVLHLCDDLQFQQPIQQPEVNYDPVSGLEAALMADSVQALISRQTRLPKSIVLRDYNDEKPSVDMQGRAEIDPNGVGTVDLFGEHIGSPEEGAELAAIRAEEIRAGKKLYFAESTVGRLLPGFQFDVVRHFRPGFNQRYQVISLSHQGRDPRFGLTPQAEQAGASYENSFSALAADVQYRPARTTPRPEIHGTLNAMIDAEADGRYAEVDEEGRYHVQMPFDCQTRDDGKASCWVRMSQVFSGENEGMHFPLHKGARVLMTFIGGDPDRPVITGSLPNSAQPSVVNAQNQTCSVIRTASGNRIELEDKEDCQRIKLSSPHMNTYMHLGAPNHAGDGWVVVTNGLERKEILGGQQLTIKANPNGHAAGNQGTVTGHGHDGGTDSTDANADLIDEKTLFAFDARGATGVAGTEMDRAEELSGKYIINRRVGPYYEYLSGDRYLFQDQVQRYKRFSFHSCFNVSVTDKDVNPAALLTTFDGVDLHGAQPFAENSAAGSANIKAKASVSLEKRDVITLRQGNTYRLGGGAVLGGGNEYAIGARYRETHSQVTDTKPLNRKDPRQSAWGGDLADSGGPDWSTVAGKDVTISRSAGDPLVAKTFGNSYSYRSGKRIEVRDGETEIHIRSKVHEYRYNADGTLIGEKKDDNPEKEWTFHPKTGGAVSYSESSNGGTAKFDLKLMPTINMAIDVSSLSTSITMAINSFAIATVLSEMKFSLGALEVDIAPPTKTKVELVGSKLGVTAGPTHIDTKAIAMDALATRLSSEAVALEQKSVSVGNAAIRLETAAVTIANGFKINS